MGAVVQLRKRRAVFRRATAWLCIAECGALLAQQPPRPVSPYSVEAAFLMNFTKFIDWPPIAFKDPGAFFEICILGEDPFGSALGQVIQGDQAEGHKLAVRHIQRPPEQKTCQILYVSDSEKHVTAILSDLGPGVLTVGNGDVFLNEGGIIAFVIEGRHVRFDIDQRAASKESLVISAKLLSVARSVRK